MPNYYAQQLNAERLVEVYRTKYPRLQQYLNAEIEYVRRYLKPTDHVLEIGAGYGRILKALAADATYLLGIDISEHSVVFGRDYLRECTNCELMVMDANQLAQERTFDAVLCLQNGLSAIKAQPMQLIAKCMEIVNPGGNLFVSTYSEAFWEHRLAWFREQAEKGLLGEIDEERTGNGVIVCKDGFTAVTHTRGDLQALGEQSGYPYRIEEVDNSSLFLVLSK